MVVEVALDVTLGDGDLGDGAAERPKTTPTLDLGPTALSGAVGTGAVDGERDAEN